MSEQKDRVDALVQDIRTFNDDLYQTVQAVRKLVRGVAPDVAETVMYGGIIFAADAPFCGVFSYKEHVSVEFGRGCDLDDPHGVLEGGGKFRRHIKLRSRSDLDTTHLQEYIQQAHRRSKALQR